MFLEEAPQIFDTDRHWARESMMTAHFPCVARKEGLLSAHHLEDFAPTRSAVAGARIRRQSIRKEGSLRTEALREKLGREEETAH
jgi:hypothetical protein